MPSASHPNILLCLFDSLTELSRGSKNNRVAIPAIAKLRESSLVFTSAYSPCPEGSPARSSVFTGLDPTVHGVWSNGVALPEHELTFPQQLARAGYTNYLVGRRQLAGVSNWTTEHCRADEFHEFEWAHGPLHRSRQNAYLNWLQQTAPEIYATIFPLQADADNTFIPTEQFAAMAELPDNLSFNHWVGLRTCELMASSQKPFCAVAAFSVGASMGTKPSPEHDLEALNLQALKQADAAIGLLLKYLNDSSLLKDTIVIVTAARGNVEPNCSIDPMREGLINVPLMMQIPDKTPQVIDSPVSTIDVNPTILELAGVPTGSRVQGQSLLAMLNGVTPFRDWALSRLRSGAPNSDEKSKDLRWWQTAFRCNNMKLVVHHGNLGKGVSIKYQLFDLLADPLETKDLALHENHAAELENMVDRLIDARCALEDRTEPRIAKF